MKFEVNSCHLFRYASELDPTDDQKKAKGGYLEGVIQLPQQAGDQRILISTMSPDSEGGSERDQFHPNMIHLLRKEEDGKNRIPTKEPVPNINHWQLELMLKTEGNVSNLHVVNKPSERDEGRNIEPTDLLFSVGPDRVIKLGKDKRNLHLTILHPKTEKRAKGDEVSLDKIVKERILDDQARAEVQKRFQGKNSKNLKKVQLRCEVFQLSSNIPIDSALSEVIRDKQSKDYGSLELKEVRPKLSCSEGGRDILVVTEHPVKKGTVVPVFQLFDQLGNRSEVHEQWLTQPQLEKPQDDDRIIRFLSPKQEHYEEWSHLTLKMKLRRKDVSDDSESISSCNFEYRPHNTIKIPMLYLQSGETSAVCIDCNSGVLDGDQSGLSGASLPQHSGPGLKRRRMSSMSSNTNRNQILINPSPAPAIHSVPVIMEDPELLQSEVGATAFSSLINLQMDGEIPSVNGDVWQAGGRTYEEIWQKVDEEEKRSSSLNTPEMEKEDFFFPAGEDEKKSSSLNTQEMEEEDFSYRSVNLREVQPSRVEQQQTWRATPPHREESELGHLAPHRVATADGCSPRQRIGDLEQQQKRRREESDLNIYVGGLPANIVPDGSNPRQMNVDLEQQQMERNREESGLNVSVGGLPHIVPDGSNPRQRIVDLEQQQMRGLTRRPPPPPEPASRGLRWWTVQSLCGEDQEAHQVFGSGGRAGGRPAGLRRQLGVLGRHCQIPVILVLATLVTFIFPVSPENLGAVLVASVLAIGFIIYQNLSQLNGE